MDPPPLQVVSLVANIAGKRIRPRPAPTTPRYHSQKPPCFSDAETQDVQKRSFPDPYKLDYIREVVVRRDPQQKKSVAVVKIVPGNEYSSKSFSLKPASAVSSIESSCEDLFSNRVLHDRLNPLIKARRQGSKSLWTEKLLENEEKRGQRASSSFRTKVTALHSVYHTSETRQIQGKGKSGLKRKSPPPHLNNKEISKALSSKVDSKSRKTHVKSLSFDISNRSIWPSEEAKRKVGSVSVLGL